MPELLSSPAGCCKRRQAVIHSSMRSEHVCIPCAKNCNEVNQFFRLTVFCSRGEQELKAGKISEVMVPSTWMSFNCFLHFGNAVRIEVGCCL